MEGGGDTLHMHIHPSMSIQEERRREREREKKRSIYMGYVFVLTAFPSRLSLTLSVSVTHSLSALLNSCTPLQTPSLPHTPLLIPSHTSDAYGGKEEKKKKQMMMTKLCNPQKVQKIVVSKRHV
jgi:hypothetical protein